jgi:hypothetical protein
MNNKDRLELEPERDTVSTVVKRQQKIRSAPLVDPCWVRLYVGSGPIGFHQPFERPKNRATLSHVLRLSWSANLHTSASALAQATMAASRTPSELVVDSSRVTGCVMPSPGASTGYWLFTKHRVTQGRLTGNTSRAAQNVVGEMDPDAVVREVELGRSLAGDDSDTVRRAVMFSGVGRLKSSFLPYDYYQSHDNTGCVTQPRYYNTVRSRSHPGHRRCFLLGRTQTRMPRTRAVLSGLVF